MDEAEDAYDDEKCFVEDEETFSQASLEDFIDDEVDDDFNTSNDHINYLKSVSDMVGHPNKYKLKYDFDPNIDVYSQAIVPDDDYQMDSFCCDEIIYEDSSSVNDNCNNSSPLSEQSKNLKNRIIPSTPKDQDSPVFLKNKRYRRVRIEETP